MDTWTALVDRYGLALSFLAVVLMAIWKLGWPLIQRLLGTLEKQLEEGRLAREQERQDFMNALNRVTTVHEAAIGRLTKSIDDMREDGRRRPR